MKDTVLIRFRKKITKQTRIGKAPNAETICGDMSYYMKKFIANEVSGRWEPKQIIAK